ncbi:chromosome segregation protein ParM [Salmonella enterica]|nr:chromosome segregation protein ParM [Salmonella enterica]HAF2409425.1 chromosome segregation protein ParM [Salmonella enterica]
MNNMQSKAPSMRLSGVQKDVLFVLYGLAERQLSGPFPAMQLFSILNKGRLQPVADTNFRRSCHTLNRHGLLNKYRDNQSLTLAFGLTEAGLKIAREVYHKRLTEME